MKKKLLLLGVLAVVLAAVAFFSGGQRQAQPGPEPVACTEEALMCPDGSGVGRTGPSCAFAPCPAMDHVDGVLERTNDGFRLVLGAPVVPGMEVSYTMPVEVGDAGTVAALIGKKVRATGTFREGNTLLVSHIEALPGAQSDRTKGTLHVGETAFINGVRITLRGITQDSRCPAGVQCIQAGWVTADVMLQSDTDKEERQMRSDAAPVQFDSFFVSIAGVTPAKKTGSEIVSQEYAVTFTVTQR